MSAAVSRDCRTEPCPLCQKRGEGDGAGQCFIADLATGTFLCEGCWTPEERASTEEEAVEVWREGTGGWTAAPHCERCKRALHVYVNGAES